MKYSILSLTVLISLCFPVSAQTALAAARDIPRGDIIAASDIRHTPMPDSVRRALAVNYADVVGMEAKRLIRTGRHIALADVRQAAMIRKGDPVTVEYASDGIRLSVSGRALADAGPGASVAVMNLYSNRSVRAEVVAPGLVRVWSR